MRRLWVFGFLLAAICPAFPQQPHTYLVGVAKIDVSPAYPIRLSGYGDRRKPSEGVAQKIWAKALAMETDHEGPAVWITVDNCALSANICNAVANRLQQKAQIPRERIAFCSSHTHSAPMLTGVLPNLFSQDIIPEEQAVVDRYTKELIDKLEEVALAALGDRRPSQLSWSRGTVGFSQNRRTRGGPVDHAFSMLRVSNPDGKVRALLMNYACHCTTLSGGFNQVHGDWAGCAQEAVEQQNPEAIALVAVGCGGDANPIPRGKPSDAVDHGNEIAAEVKRLLKQSFTPLSASISCRMKQIDLPFEDHPTSDQWEKRAQQKGIVGYHARKNLARLDRGEKLPTTIPYVVQTWNFGDELAFVFLAGEVVVDYQLRLKKEYDASRLWVTAYANDVPCYIPSKRVLGEGGYEAEESLWYYDRPAKFRPEIEERIIAAVHEVMPKQFRFDEQKAEFPPPKSVEQALTSFRTRADLKIELVAAEPLIVDPVAVDFGADGKLWVCEMHDYPSGLDGNGKLGGRIKVLEDSTGTGRYNKSTLFLDGLPFPTGVMAWKKGALICAAPDILYAEDTNGDGKADVVKKLYSGFATHNFQARVNGLSWGLDGWVYGAAGLFGGRIESSITGKAVDLSGRDFRIHPDNGDFEPVSGLSQQGRVRDDFGNWFGCDNSTLIWHFPMPEHYLRRNPHVPAPEPRLYPVRDADPNQLYPASRTLERFNEPNAANRTTSACGLEIYRDELLGPEYRGNAFVCEPVHNLVHRLRVQSDGVGFAATRDPDEQHSEFLASTDNWFRPVQVRTGPDGALWIVDMYRFVVEHPRWIPKERLAKLDVRAGDDKGRIYRLVPEDSQRTPRRIPNVRSMPTSELATLLASRNGVVRDLAHQEILFRKAKPEAIGNVGVAGVSPGAKVQILSVLQTLGSLPTSPLQKALQDSDPRVRREAVRLSESFPFTEVANSLPLLLDDVDKSVRFQLALSLGQWTDPDAGKLLGKVAVSQPDRWTQFALLSSALPHCSQLAEAVLSSPAPSSELLSRLVATAVGAGKRDDVSQIWKYVESGPSLPRLTIAEAIFRATERNRSSVDKFFVNAPALIASLRQTVRLEASGIATDTSADPILRASAIPLVARETKEGASLLSRLIPSGNSTLDAAAIEGLARMGGTAVPELLFSRWPSFGPALRALALNALLNRKEWSAPVLDAISDGKIAAAEVPLATRERLLKSKEPLIAKRAHALFDDRVSGDRASVIERFRSTSNLKGDQNHGSQLFEKLCSSCHALNRKGHAVGPDLAPLRDKPVDYFLLAILDPNAAIEPRFVAYEIETKSGRSLAGVIQSETANELTVVQAGGLKEQIFRTDLESIRATSRSLMPEGLEQGAAPQDFADLIAFLKLAGPARFGSATSPQAAAAQAQFLKDGGSSLRKLIFASENLPYRGWLGGAQMPHCRQTDGKSRLAWEGVPLKRKGEPSKSMRFRFPIAMGFISQPRGDFTMKINGRETVRFDVSLSDAEWQSASSAARLRYTVMEANEEDSNGLLEIELPQELVAEGPVQFEVLASAANSQRWFGIYLTEAADVHASR